MFGFSEPDVPKVTVDELKASLDSKEDVLLLDVRTPEEFGRNRLKGAINLPIDQVSEKALSVIPDKNRKVYVYCLSGSRSVHGVDMMKKLGYTSVYNVASGLLAWRANHFPVEE